VWDVMWPGPCAGLAERSLPHDSQGRVARSLPQGGMTSPTAVCPHGAQARTGVSPPSSRFVLPRRRVLLMSRRQPLQQAQDLRVGRRLRQLVCSAATTEGFDERIRGLADEEVPIA